MADLVPSLTHLEPPRLVPLQLDRFSPHFDRPEDFGIVPLGPRRDFRFVYPADRVDEAALAEIAYSFDFDTQTDEPRGVYGPAPAARSASGRRTGERRSVRCDTSGGRVSSSSPIGGLASITPSTVSPSPRRGSISPARTAPPSRRPRVRHVSTRATGRRTCRHGGRGLPRGARGGTACLQGRRPLSLAGAAGNRAPVAPSGAGPGGGTGTRARRTRVADPSPAWQRGEAGRDRPGAGEAVGPAQRSADPSCDRRRISARDSGLACRRTAHGGVAGPGDRFSRRCSLPSPACPRERGVFAERSGRRFALTPISRLLRNGAPGSMRSIAVLAGEEWARAWYDLPHAVRTGRPAFEHAFGTSFYDWLAGERGAARRFDEAMRYKWETLREEVVAAYDFSEASRIVDVGGGSGSLIEAILDQNVDATGVLLETPAVAAEARRRLRAAGLHRRCSVVAGDFLRSVPSGGDLYILAYVLHNWDDRHAVRILRNCRRAMAAGGRLLVVESLLPPGRRPSPGEGPRPRDAGLHARRS